MAPKMMKRYAGVLVVITLLVITVMARAALDNSVFLPIVMVQLTATPTQTASLTPTATLTPTSTPTPRITGVKVVEVVQSENVLDPLNEYVSLHNFSYTSEDLTGWFIRDDGLNRYNFPINFLIPAGKTIRVWTKEGTNTVTDLYWGSEVEVWNNFHECAYLRDDSDGENLLVDIFCYAKQINGPITVWRVKPESFQR